MILPSSITPQLDSKENILVVRAQKFYQLSKSKLKSRPRRGILCATFIQAKNNSVPVKLAFANMNLTASFCRWAIIMYRGSDADVKMLCDEANRREGNRLVRCARTQKAIDFSPNKTNTQKAVAKSILYRDLLPVLPDFERVFLIDEDISLQNFDFEKYLKIWNCGFFPNKPPLITQPVIAESTQDFVFVNADYWRGTGVIAAGSGYVEQQAPFFDAVFLEWFVRFVLVYTIEKVLSVGADWGMDHIWCGAAQAYAHRVIGWPSAPVTVVVPAPNTVSNGTGTVAGVGTVAGAGAGLRMRASIEGVSNACGLIVGTVVNHKNFHSMSTKREVQVFPSGVCVRVCVYVSVCMCVCWCVCECVCVFFLCWMYVMLANYGCTT